jgi:transcription termination factor Rho
MNEADLQRVWILRKLLNDMEDTAATEFIIDRLKNFESNDDFFAAMKRK